MRYFLSLFLLISFQISSASESFQHINSFTVKENLLKNDKLAIIATDSLAHPLENINGTFNFSVNGFKQSLYFNNGVAVCSLPIEKSSFVFIKHENENGSHSNLYYVVKHDGELNPIRISWYLLLAIPIGLILIGYMFRKLIGLIIFILVAIVYFNFSKGLSIPTFFESIFDGLKNLF
ncbi:hypothetical protein N9R54_06515 [Pelobium sp.]|nr:hypothetical protein [Pelobium sp.]MDA9555868.1 hypothetical protein [Pelobium sp.]